MKGNIAQRLWNEDYLPQTHITRIFMHAQGQSTGRSTLPAAGRVHSRLRVPTPVCTASPGGGKHFCTQAGRQRLAAKFTFLWINALLDQLRAGRLKELLGDLAETVS